MAGIHPLDPLKLLRVSPLIISTATLTVAVCETHFYGVFLHERHRKKSGDILPSWWKANFDRVIVPFLGTYALNITLGIVNVLTRPEDLTATGARLWYFLGLVGTIAHFTFGPASARHIQDITEQRSTGKSVEAMGRWIAMAKLRILIIDFPGWFGNFMGVLASIAV